MEGSDVLCTAFSLTCVVGACDEIIVALKVRRDVPFDLGDRTVDETPETPEIPETAKPLGVLGFHRRDQR